VTHDYETAASTGRQAQAPATPTLHLGAAGSRTRKDSREQTSAPPALRIPSAEEPAVIAGVCRGSAGFPPGSGSWIRPNPDVPS